jgi:heterodisulfide reductase subunit A
MARQYLYEEDDRVMTNLELEERIAGGDEMVTNAESLVMIQCVGCRNEERNYCSRICCSQSIKNALKLKEIKPEIDIYILYRDMRTYGFREDYYREAADQDVRFIHFEPDESPRVEAVEEGGRSVLRVIVTDDILGREIGIDADVIALAAAVIPAATTDELSRQFKVSQGPDGFLKEAHVKLRPVDFAEEGVFLCGTAHYPKHISEAISQAYGAAGRALTLLSHDSVVASGSVCDVHEKKCIGCGACVTACTYAAIELQDTKEGKKAVVNPVLCTGDGLCNAMCPTRAIQLRHYTDEELVSQIDTAVPDLVEVD